MSQISKTLIFLGVAAVVVALVVVWNRPAELKTDNSGLVGEKLIADFDPFKAADLQITDYNQATGEPQSFEVKQVESKGRTLWSIPSKENYPADAKDQVAQAASSLMGLKVLGVVGESQEDHELYGVVDPKKAKDNSHGVGMRVTLCDKQGKDLVSLIVGKEVPQQKGQRYVRMVDQNPVYIVAMKTDSLSTRFDRWIEKSLLQINPWDISKLWIRDHSVENQALHERNEMVLQYSDRGEPHWKMVEDRQMDDATGQWKPVAMAADETLNTAKLDELKSALGELQIIDVERKPAGLSADLKASEDFIKSKESILSLQARGFYISKSADGYEMFSNNGEIRSTMNDGVEYILRFGAIALESTAAGATDEKAKEGEAENKDEKKGPGLNRYLFVMARFNQDGIPKPEEKPLPGDKPAEGTPATNNPPVPPTSPGPADAAPAANPAPAETPKPADENKPAPEEQKTPVDAKPTSYAGQNPTDEKPADAKPADAPPAADKPAEEKAAAAPLPPPVDQKPAEGQPAAGPDHPDENPIALPADPKALEAAREQAEKENKRKRDEYDEKVKAGKKRVDELNARFADWFYIISDETYRKIHLNREAVIIKKSEKKEEKPGDTGGLPPGMPGLPPGMPMPGGN
jgi:hypothetical protein